MTETPEMGVCSGGLQAFCRFLAQWSSASLVLALEGGRGREKARVIASNVPLHLKNPEVPSIPSEVFTGGTLVTLDSAAMNLPPALTIHATARLQPWFFLPGGIPHAEASGVLFIGARDDLAKEERALLLTLTEIFREMLSDHRQLRQRRYFAAKFHDLFDSVPTGIIVIEGDGLTGHVNRSAAQLLGCEAGIAAVPTIAAAMQRLRAS